MLKIIWLSSNRFGYELLKKALEIEHADIIGIITLSRKAKTVMYDGIDQSNWYSFGINVFEIDYLNDEKELLLKLNPDLIIMCGWRQKIKKEQTQNNQRLPKPYNI